LSEPSLRHRILEFADEVRAEERQVNAGELQALAAYRRKQQAKARLFGIDVPSEDESEAA
jgi:hypothetical protein